MVTIPASDSEGRVSVSVPIAVDGIAENDEQFGGTLTLPAGSTGVALGVRDAEATIVDNDCECLLNLAATL